ncbi:divalent cation transporter [Planctomycetaceae bacterium]|jgi:zinc transporter, ZIP family|nr:divalent cation transporter [Planctomycetaceae bacterium]MDG2389801.1 divalent cation transporter [Planctomycetaceae bacterium]
MTTALFFAFIAGLAIPVGGFLAWCDKISPDWGEEEFHHSIIAFGGGALLSAVALVLVPEGAARLTPLPAVVSFVLGGIAFYGLDCLLDRLGGSVAQLVAMVSDFIPEAIALGATFASGESSALLIAGMIGLQNLPEGFNSYREMTSDSQLSSRNVLIAFSLLSLLGPAAAFIGLEFFAEREGSLGVLMLFASGGILYLTFEDIAPQAVLKNSRLPALGSIAGFALGLIGYMFTG